MAFTDSFTYADGNLSGKGSWLTPSGDTSLTVASNLLSVSTGGGGSDGANYYNNTFANDQYAQLVMTTVDAGGGAGTGLGVAVRMATGAITYYRCVACTLGTELLKMVAGTPTVLKTDATTWANGDTLYLSVSGSSPSITLTVKRNGSTIAAMTVTNETSIASGKAGVCYSSSDTAARADTWEGGDLGGAETITVDKWFQAPADVIRWKRGMVASGTTGVKS